MSSIANISVLANVHDSNDVHVLLWEPQDLGQDLVEFLLLGFLVATLDDELLCRGAWDDRTMQPSSLLIPPSQKIRVSL